MHRTYLFISQWIQGFCSAYCNGLELNLKMYFANEFEYARLVIGFNKVTLFQGIIGNLGGTIEAESGGRYLC